VGKEEEDWKDSKKGRTAAISKKDLFNNLVEAGLFRLRKNKGG